MSGGSVNSPNVGNYYIGKGIMSVQLPTDIDYVDVGNVPSFEFQAKPTLSPHYSSRAGTKVRDFTAVTQKEGTLTLVMEEFTARNLAMCLMGSVKDSPQGTQEVDIMSENVVIAKVKFTGTNDIGPQLLVEFPRVILTPSKAIALIGDNWGQCEFNGDVLADPTTGHFGTITTHLSESP